MKRTQKKTEKTPRNLPEQIGSIMRQIRDEEKAASEKPARTAIHPPTTPGKYIRVKKSRMKYFGAVREDSTPSQSEIRRQTKMDQLIAKLGEDVQLSAIRTAVAQTVIKEYRGPARFLFQSYDKIVQECLYHWEQTRAANMGANRDTVPLGKLIENFAKEQARELALKRGYRCSPDGSIPSHYIQKLALRAREDQSLPNHLREAVSWVLLAGKFWSNAPYSDIREGALEMYRKLKQEDPKGTPDFSLSLREELQKIDSEARVQDEKPPYEDLSNLLRTLDADPNLTPEQRREVKLGLICAPTMGDLLKLPYSRMVVAAIAQSSDTKKGYEQEFREAQAKEDLSGKGIDVLHVGTNDLSVSRTPKQIKADLKEFTKTLKEAGFKTITRSFFPSTLLESLDKQRSQNKSLLLKQLDHMKTQCSVTKEDTLAFRRVIRMVKEQDGFLWPHW